MFLYRAPVILFSFSGTVYPDFFRDTLVRHIIAEHYRPKFLDITEYYLPGGEVLKLLRIKSHRKKRIKAVSSFIVNKLPHKDAMV